MPNDTNTGQDVAVRAPNFETEFTAYADRHIATALPAHMPLSRFKRVVLTAVSLSPDLLNAERRSLFTACAKCAADGLVPDNREAALVVFNTKTKDGGWEKRVQYLPMIQGILKRARNTGELSSVSAQVVYENDDFDYVLGDEEQMTHKPPKLGMDRGKPIGAYAVAKLKDGTIQREIMGFAEIEKARAVSRAKDAPSGPWVQWWSEQARKTVARRLFKWLPNSADLGNLFGDDEGGDMPALPMIQAPDAAPQIEGRAEPAVEDAPRARRGRPRKDAAAAEVQPPQVEQPLASPPPAPPAGPDDELFS